VVAMRGTVTVLHYAAAGNPRTNHSATAVTNEQVSEATRLAEVAVSGPYSKADIGVIQSWEAAADPKRTVAGWR